jgi:hypothetical protein
MSNENLNHGSQSSYTGVCGDNIQYATIFFAIELFMLFCNYGGVMK